MKYWFWTWRKWKLSIWSWAKLVPWTQTFDACHSLEIYSNLFRDEGQTDMTGFLMFLLVARGSDADAEKFGNVSCVIESLPTAEDERKGTKDIFTPFQWFTIVRCAETSDKVCWEWVEMSIIQGDDDNVKFNMKIVKMIFHIEWHFIYRYFMHSNGNWKIIRISYELINFI